MLTIVSNIRKEITCFFSGIDKLVCLYFSMFYMSDTFFTYIPVRSVVSDDPVKSYTYAETGKLINKHTRGLLKAIYDYAKNDDEFPTDLKKMTDKEIDSLIDSLVKKIDPSGLSSYQEYVQVF